MHFAVLSGYLVSIAAPSLHRVTRGLTGWVMALLPAGLFVYFAGFIAPVSSGQAYSVAFPWVPGMGINLSFYLDGLSLLFVLLITGIGALVMIYAGSYLEGHEQLGRFYAYLAMFMASMLGVVLADNLLAMFIFWELTSLSSFLLIGFEHEESGAREAAGQALLVTGGGGLALMAGVVLLSQAGGSPELSFLVTRGETLRGHPLYLPILLLILAGAFTKSAQFPFHFWLPNAMEAPTPVSAYLHSATMVKAGIYLLARLSPALGGTSAWLYLVAGAGLLTTLFGAILALNHSNAKRILAYSTISSLGTMTLLIGVGGSGAIQAAVVFLLAHALYKGALFMIAGAIYHETGTQDVDELGGLWRSMPVLGVVTILSALSLAGFGPFLSFIGKEMLFEALLEAPRFTQVFIPAAVVSTAVSAAVALILVVRPFFGPQQPTPQAPHEPPLPLFLGPALLAALGFALGLFPAAISDTIVAPAAAAITGQPTSVTLSLWHGFNLALGLSGVSILSGLLLYRLWAAWRRGAARLAEAFPWGPARGYQALLDGTTRIASLLTETLQTGHLHDYVMIVIATSVGLSGLTLLSLGDTYQALTFPELTFFEAALTILILMAALAVVRSTSRLASVAALGVVGFGVALIFILFGAPDLAMTQFLVESVTVILLVLILYHLPKFAQLSSKPARARDAVIALAGGGVMTALVLIANVTERFSPISSFFIENSLPEGHGRNIVNVILVDFRGMDTFGEITVLSLAAIGVYALLRLRLKR